MIKGIKISDGKLLTFDEFLASNHGYPPALLRSILPDPRFAYQPEHYRVGEIIGCLRNSYFERTLGSYHTIEQLIRSSTGIAIHNAILEGYDMKEIQMSFDFDHNGQRLYMMGKFDGYDLKTKTLAEVKTVQDIDRISKARPKDSLQLQCFGTLANQTLPDLKVDTLQLIYSDLSRVKTFTINADDKMEFMRQRVIALHEALKAKKATIEEESQLCTSCPYNNKCSLPAYLTSRMESKSRRY